MQACLDNTSLPLLDSAPKWTIRLARPAALGCNELSRELQGVPKAALCHVFGKVMGTALWQQHRPTVVAAKCPNVVISPNPSTQDTEISSALLRYLCAEASAKLREHQRFAKLVALTVLYSNGESETVIEPLPRPANNPTVLEGAARTALRAARSDAFVSLKLDLTATSTQA